MKKAKAVSLGAVHTHTHNTYLVKNIKMNIEINAEIKPKF